MNRTPVKYKVARGVWRTKAETCALLGLPPGTEIPAFVCKLPLPHLKKLVEATAARMKAKQDEETATGTSEIVEPLSRPTFEEEITSNEEVAA
jgi:hypothetical protein